MKGLIRSGASPHLLVLACLSFAACDRPHRSAGEKVARNYCAACHAFPEPQLLDKKSWEGGVLPQMAPRLGVFTGPSFNDVYSNPYLMVLRKRASNQEWEQIVQYYRDNAPEVLPPQVMPAQPTIDSTFLQPAPFLPRMESSGIITLLKTDSARGRIFVGDAGTTTLRIFDWDRRLVSSLRLGSPPTDLAIDGNHVLLLESGILNPNDEPRGTLAQYDFAGNDSLRSPRILIDSLFRPVFFQQVDFDKDGRADFLICEYGDNRGRLALYRYNGSRYERQTIDDGPGAIRFEVRDMTGDGAPDIVALFAQGDERIMLFENDGQGHFSGRVRELARFAPVYGSMFFSMHDFNGDGKLDILYVNGDNFDYSRVLKPYHGVRILENDGRNNFHERYFFPIYGAARAEVADFDKDGDLDILTTSNFPDHADHPERGIMFFENKGRYDFRPHSFSIAAGNQWNLTATGDFNRDGWLDVIVGAMDLGSVARFQQRSPRPESVSGRDPLLVFENRMQSKRAAGPAAP